MNILITGVNGFIGSEFLKNLNTNVLKKYSIFGLTRSHPKRKITQLKKIKFIRQDLIEKNLTRIKKNKFNIVIHFAAQANHQISNKLKNKTKADNVIATKNLIESIDKECLFIFTSTDKVYNPRTKCSEKSSLKPQSYLAKQKIICENLIKLKFKKYFIFRLPIVHSNGRLRNSSIIDQFLYDLKNKKKINVFSNIKRSFIKTTELNKAILKCFDNKNYGTYNVGTNLFYYDVRVMQLFKSSKNRNFLNRVIGKVKPKTQLFNVNKAKRFLNTKFT